MRHFFQKSILFLCLLIAAKAAADSPGDLDIGKEAIEIQARRHIDEGNPGEAITILRGKADTEERSLLLARAYLDDGNDFWAMRVLHDLAQTSEDCSAHLWLVFLHIRQGALEEGNDLLEIASCKEESPLELRHLLLQTLVATTAGDEPQAIAAILDASKAKLAFPEDLEAFRILRSSIEPGYIRPISGRMELQTGWTANALAGSPIDPAAMGGPPSSPLASLSANTRLIVPTQKRPRPVLDAELRSLGFMAEAGQSLSYLQLSARPGLLFGTEGKFFSGYRFDSLGILGGDQFGDGPIWFYQAHRAEVEMEILPWLTAFGGAGYRNFREARRSRLEFDGGLGGAWRAFGTLNILGALMGRYHSAARNDYDLFGATALVQAEQRLPMNLSARIGLVASLDDYPSSAGYFETDLSRRDFLAKITAGLWLPRSRAGLRGGISYEFSNRFSSAPLYRYLDHRLLARVQWAFAMDPRGPSPTSPANHVPLAWGLETDDGGLEENIQDLLRQDEAVRAGSSCVD